MERNKGRFDKRVTPSVLEVGDRVLVCNVRLRGKHKLKDKWERDVYVVVNCAGDLSVYTVRLEKATEISFCCVVSSQLVLRMSHHFLIPSTNPKPVVSRKLTRIPLKVQRMTKWTISRPCTLVHLLDSESI